MFDGIWTGCPECGGRRRQPPSAVGVAEHGAWSSVRGVARFGKADYNFVNPQGVTHLLVGEDAMPDDALFQLGIVSVRLNRSQTECSIRAASMTSKRERSPLLRARLVSR
ncbi:MAG TPA: hypothetical protein PKJ45_07850 [Rubrivivax sp.]|nr:hypothetical protein [Burkholderiales bacterium]HNU11263.1 hypothetical protein [Rubrivivax sp.]